MSHICNVVFDILYRIMVSVTYAYENGENILTMIKTTERRATAMIIEIQKNPAETILQIAGRLDTTTAPSLDKTINEDISDTKNLVFDLKDLEYISSAGLRVLLGAQKKMQKIGSMKVINVCEEIMEIFEMTGFVDILVIENGTCK